MVNTKINLCDTCVQDVPNCTCTSIEYGDGVGNDNIVKCDGYQRYYNTGMKTLRFITRIVLLLSAIIIWLVMIAFLVLVKYPVWLLSYLCDMISSWFEWYDRWHTRTYRSLK